MSIMTKIIPAKKPSKISLSSIALMYNIPKNPVIIIVMIGTTMLAL